MNLISGTGARLLAAVLVLLVGPGMSVVCVASSGHSAIENAFSPCCAGRGAPGGSGPGGPLLLAPAAVEGCADCTDLALQGTPGSDPDRTVHPQQPACPAAAAAASVALPWLRGLDGRAPGRHALRAPLSSTPLRC
ncbi:MAG: hypothetical protein IT158_30435 [Bryobacterales bacterium]|nr:hypothetical protein [Bryobacterales bacterium]